MALTTEPFGSSTPELVKHDPAANAPELDHLSMATEQDHLAKAPPPARTEGLEVSCKPEMLLH